MTIKTTMLTPNIGWVLAMPTKDEDIQIHCRDSGEQPHRWAQVIAVSPQQLPLIGRPEGAGVLTRDRPPAFTLPSLCRYLEDPMVTEMEVEEIGEGPESTGTRTLLLIPVEKVLIWMWTDA